MNVTVSWHDGEILSGWQAHGEDAKILERYGVAKFVGGWGYRVDDAVVRALGESFTEDHLAVYCKPRLDEEKAKEKQERTEREKAFLKARQTGNPQPLDRWCEEVEEEDNSLNICTSYAMPDGSTTVQRTPTY
jgi:hypothetical protein